MINFNSMFREVGRFFTRNSAGMLTGFAAIGVVGTSVLAVKGSQEAIIIKQDLRYDGIDTDTDKVYTLKAVLPAYVPCIVMGTMTIACIFGASAIHSRRNAVIAGLYSASELAMKEYRSKVIETIGDKKEVKIREDIAKDRMDNNPLSHNQVIVTASGDSLCYDSWTGRYFKADIEKIRAIQNVINRDVIAHMWVPQNDLYFLIGLPPVKGGETVGWNVDNLLDFNFSSHIADNGQPCLVLDYSVKPYSL